MRGSTYSRAVRLAGAALLLMLTQVVTAADAAADAKKRPKWGPDNPKPFILKYQKYVGPFMAMLTFVILGGMILFICMYERKERNQWPFGPWNPVEEKKKK